MRINNVRATVVLVVCGLGVAGSVGCAASRQEAGPATVESAAAAPVEPAPTVMPLVSAPVRPSSADRFKVQTQEGLTFRLDSLSASVQVYTHNRKGRPQVRRDISINGSVQDPLGRRLFRIAGVELESMTDGEGRSLLDGAEVSENPAGYNDGWESIRVNRSPGSATSQSYNIQVGDLDSLPARLGTISGHVDVELVTDLVTIDLVLEESDGFVTLEQGVSYRVSMFRQEGSTLRYVIEYRLARAAADAQTPRFMGLDARDPRGQPISLNTRPLETVLGDSVQGIIQGEVGLSRGGLGPVRMLLATAVSPVRFDFEFGDIALTEGAARR